jgi:hypothetical protein
MRLTGLLSSALLYSTALAIGQESTINFNSTGLRLAEKGSSVQLYADGHDWPGVLRVVDDLAEDFGRVTGTSGTVTLLGNGTSPIYNASTTFNVIGRTGFGNVGPERYGSKGGAIIAGTIGNSTIIDRLIREGKVDVSEIEGHWEAYTSTVVDNPVQGVSRAVVIAGELLSLACAHDYVLTSFQEPTREELFTDCTLFPNRLVFLHGTSGPTRRHRSTALSTRNP